MSDAVTVIVVAVITGLLGPVAVVIATRLLRNDHREVNQRLAELSTGQTQIRAEVASLRTDVAELRVGQKHLESEIEGHHPREGELR